MASYPHHTPYTSSAPSSYPRQAPQPYPTQGQSRTASSQPSSRQPTRKKSFNPERDSSVADASGSGHRSVRSVSFTEAGQIVWAVFDSRTLGHGAPADISSRLFLVLVTSVGPGDEISFLFLYSHPPAIAGEYQLPPALRPKPHHSLVLNATTPRALNCVIHGMPFSDVYVWTSPPVIAKVAEVHPGRYPPVTVQARELYSIKQYAQGDQIGQNETEREACMTGRHQFVASGYSREARVQLFTDINARRELRYACDPCVILGYLYSGTH